MTLPFDVWPIVDVGLYALALWVLTAGGNFVCRWLLELSGITPPSTTATAAATSAVVSPASAPSPAFPTAASPPVPPAPATSAGAGRMIGSLERLIILVGLIAGSWEIIAAVIALKTVGRFKELDERLQAEYFLIGSLASIVWAALVSLILMQFDRTWGFHIATLLQVGKGN
jgi:hypothetical protein